MKRYILFGGSDIYYASGGGHDFLKSSDKIDDLVLYAKEISNTHIGSLRELEWWHIFDVMDGEIILGTKEQAHGAGSLIDDISIDL